MAKKTVKRILKKVKNTVGRRKRYTSKKVFFADKKNSLLSYTIGNYISSNKKKRPRFPASIIDLNEHKSFDDYLSKIKKEHYKSAFYPLNRSKKEGYYSKEFRLENFVPDIVETNHSIPFRQGREMSDAYKKSIEDYGGAPVAWKEIQPPKQPNRYKKMFGVFKEEKARKQGEITTNEQLIGYISFTREGNLGLYSQILGHAEYLKKRSNV